MACNSLIEKKKKEKKEKGKKKNCLLSGSVFLSLANADFPFLGIQHGCVWLLAFLGDNLDTEANYNMRGSGKG